LSVKAAARKRRRHPDPRPDRGRCADRSAQNEVGRITPPEDLLGSGDHFALEVKGDSMIQAGILDGDVVIIKRSRRPIAAISSWPWSTTKKRR
jgi:hypothetical protein